MGLWSLWAHLCSGGWLSVKADISKYCLCGTVLTKGYAQSKYRVFYYEFITVIILYTPWKCNVRGNQLSLRANRRVFRYMICPQTWQPLLLKHV